MKTVKVWQKYRDPDLCGCRHCKSFVVGHNHVPCLVDIAGLIPQGLQFRAQVTLA